jgi:hypothetical protein
VVLVEKPELKRPLGRSRHRWMVNVKRDLGEIRRGGVDWIDLAQNRDECKALVNTVMNVRVPQTKTKLHGLSPRANYTDRATTACRHSDCQLLRIEGATWSA